MNCAICDAGSSPVFTKTVLFAYRVQYFRCGRCGFVQTESPYWLDEAYSLPIASLDVGLVHRNITTADKLALIIDSTFDHGGRFLDYAGGYGLFVRIMRDRGYDFFWTDRYCPNIFAQHFSIDDLDTNKADFKLVTAIEVMEHLVDPYRELDEMLGHSRSVLFTTELAPDHDLENWWYLVPETGQHVSFYTLDSLRIIADRLHLQFYSDGHGLHLFTDCTLSVFPPEGRRVPWWRRWAGNRKGALKPSTRLLSDFEHVRKIVAERKQ